MLQVAYACQMPRQAHPDPEMAQVVKQLAEALARSLDRAGRQISMISMAIIIIDIIYIYIYI